MVTKEDLTKENNRKSLEAIFDFVDYLFDNIENHKQAVKDYEDLDSKRKSFKSQPDNYNGQIKKNNLNAEIGELYEKINSTVINPLHKHLDKYNRKVFLEYSLLNLFSSVNGYTIQDCVLTSYIQRAKKAKERYETYRKETNNVILFRIGGERLINYIEYGNGEKPESGLKFIFDWFIPDNDFKVMHVKKTDDYRGMVEVLKPYIHGLTPEVLEHIYLYKSPGKYPKPIWRSRRNGMRFFDWINEGRSDSDKMKLSKFNELFEGEKGTKFKGNDNDPPERRMSDNTKREEFMKLLEPFPKP